MFDRNNLKISDIHSNPEPSDQYIEANQIYQNKFKFYQPQQEILNEIHKILEENHEKFSIIAFGATWCGDCRINIPKIAKISKVLNNKNFTVGILGNIKVKPPYERIKGELIWKVPPSPPESLNIKFDMFHIPAIFIFNKHGNCIGKIDEHPVHTKSIEEEILFYINKDISISNKIAE